MAGNMGLLCVLLAFTGAWWLQTCQADRQETERIELEYTVVEELEPHTAVGNIRRGAHLDEKYGADNLKDVRFSFLRQGGQHSEYFFIQAETGVLRTIKVIDKEEICEHKAVTCEMEFDVVARPVPVHYLEIIGVKINILDLNDHEPKFPQDRITFSVSETVMPQVSFILPPAQDPDSGNYGIQRYDIISSSNKFGLSVTNTIDGTPDIRLVLLETLNREEQAEYSLQVVARDGGAPPKYGSVTVDIDVVDANDNSPHFENSSYEVLVGEDAPTGSVIVQVHASDPDEGPNGKVVYSLSTDTLERYTNVFAIQNETGEIWLKGELDFEKEQIYRLLVQAKDQGADSVPTAARVVIHVKDINDHAPKVLVNALTPSGRVQVPEGTGPGHFVAHISVEDLDNGPNGETYCVMGDDRFQLQKIYHNEYKMITSSLPFDREKNGTFRVSLTCMDRGNPPLKSTIQILGKVTDLNDNGPTFAQDVYVVSMKENNTANIVLTVLNVTDRDEGENSRLTFSLKSEDTRGMVGIDSATGVIRAHTVFDYEKMHNFQFRVVARDNGDPVRSSTATVVLHLIDINDEPPIFYRDVYNFRIMENQSPGRAVGTVAASDRDAAPYNEIIYSLEGEGGSDRLPFVIDPRSGKIMTRKSLDREKKPVYTLLALAKNPGYPHLTSSAHVIVKVDDLNDNPPLIHFPSPVNNTIELVCMKPGREAVIRIDARDPDEARNSKLSYSLTKGNDGGVFNIDPVTGAITVSKEILRTRQESFYLHIVVTDHGEPPKSAVTSLHLVVNNTGPCPDGGALRVTSVLFTTGRNKVILLSIAGGTVFLVLILISAILTLKHKDNRRTRKDYRYTCPVRFAHRKKKRRSSQDGDDPNKQERVGSLYSFNGEGDTQMKEVRFEVPEEDLDHTATILSNNWKNDLPAAKEEQFGDNRSDSSRTVAVNHVNHLPHPAADDKSDSAEVEMPPDPSEGQKSRTPPCGASLPVQQSPQQLELLQQLKQVQQQQAAKRFKDPRDFLPDRAPKQMCGSAEADRAAREWALTEKALEVHQLLQIVMRRPLLADADSVSAHSGDNDSGRGTSEDGDQHGKSSPRTKGPPPPYESLLCSGNADPNMFKPDVTRNANGEKCPICTDDSPDFKKDLGPHHQHSAHCESSPVSLSSNSAREDTPLMITNKGKYPLGNVSNTLGSKRTPSASRLTSSSGSSMESFGTSPELNKYRTAASYKDEFKVHLLSPEVRKYRKGNSSGIGGVTNRTNTFGQNFPLKVLGTTKDIKDPRDARLKDNNSLDSYSTF